MDEFEILPPGRNVAGEAESLTDGEWERGLSTNLTAAFVAVRAVRKDSLVEVDDRREGDSERLQLSNFSIIEDRETLDLEIYITRIGEDPQDFWRAGVYRYRFTPPV